MSRIRRRLAAALAAPLALALVTATPGTASARSAAATIPSFDFADCPQLPAGADPFSWQCNQIIVSSGTMKLGKVEQPISKPMSITYATGFDPGVPGVEFIFGKLRAEKMKVPGGLIGVPGSDPIDLTSVYALPKYAGHLSFPDGGFNARLWLRVQLINPLLRSTCHIGTTSNPIKLNLTMVGDAEVVSEDPVVLKLTVQDNTFAVPGASGCGLFNGGLLDKTVNLRAGIPSPSGSNSANFTQFVSFKTYSDIPAAARVAPQSATADEQAEAAAAAAAEQ
ncbi:hypothetical protein [Bailinhaonella thermotolerans]|uniref:Secreted protein n=1 Tax=Bailinhaonella thermotolerans TaxID=1070861 RepID=A0A3A4A264_9ACTN|nr:hypothetical protein [Bailinhaonella thermotolerans]RJL20666.1 hypothetical protein D5H75_39020 [Bailinhaonella thermotolerans]